MPITQWLKPTPARIPCTNASTARTIQRTRSFAGGQARSASSRIRMAPMSDRRNPKPRCGSRLFALSIVAPCFMSNRPYPTRKNWTITPTKNSAVTYRNATHAPFRTALIPASCSLDSARRLERRRSGIVTDPDRDGRGLERAGSDRGELGEDGVDIDRVAQPGAERGDNRFGVVAGAVEAAIDEPLQTTPQRAEQRRGGKRRGRDADRRGERQ